TREGQTRAVRPGPRPVREKGPRRREAGRGRPSSQADRRLVAGAALTCGWCLGYPTRRIRMDGNAIVWCEGHFATTSGRPAHGLVRFTRRYRVTAVIDSTLAGRDAGEVLDGRPAGIPLVAGLDDALKIAPATHLVVGLAPDGGRLPPVGRRAVLA